MKIFRSILFVLLAFSSLTTISHAQPADSVDLRLHLKKGDMYSLTCSTKTESTTEIGGAPETFFQTMTTEYAVSVDEVRESGVTILTLKLLSATMSIKSKSMELRIDSRDPKKSYGSKKTARDVANDSYNETKKLIGLAFWVKLNERAEVISTNVDTVFDQKGDMNQSIAGNAKEALQMASFAGYPVKIGDTWKGIVYSNKEGKAISEASQYTLQSLRKGIAKITSDSKGWGDVTDANLSATFSGEHSVDIASGLATEAHYKMEMEAKKDVAPFKSKSDIAIKIKKK